MLLLLTGSLISLTNNSFHEKDLMSNLSLVARMLLTNISWMMTTTFSQLSWVPMPAVSVKWALPITIWCRIIATKGKVYKFDDMHYVPGLWKQTRLIITTSKKPRMVNFEEPHNFIPAQKAFLLKRADLHSPMRGNVASFTDENKLQEAIKNIKGQTTTWYALINEK